MEFMFQNQLKGIIFLFAIIFSNLVFSQNKLQTINAIENEARQNSQLESLGYALFDEIGPRLVGTPGMKKSHDWVVSTYQSWGIEAKNEKFGEWLGWERGITHIDMIYPRIVSLEGRMLAWSAPSGRNPIIAEVIRIPMFQDSFSFKAWLPQVKGKIVMASKYEITGRPESSWKEHALEEDYNKIVKERSQNTKDWQDWLKKIGQTEKSIHNTLENAGAAAIITSYWAGGWGTNRIFGTTARKVPVLDIRMEDYGMLYRMVSNGKSPKIRIVAESKYLGKQPTYNTIGTIKGTGPKSDEIVMLSAHLDSWDAGTGATDNGTGTILLMEVMRILKKVYPNPKRTIMAGHWGSEEQGLNGSRGFVADHPELHSKISLVLNQDNGTGRVNNISGQGFLNAYDYFSQWLELVPEWGKSKIETSFPSSPDTRGNSDHAPFVHAGIPAFFLLVNSYDYGTYTWHSQLDTYDKVNFDDVRRNAVLFATLVYLACEEPEKFDRTPALLPKIKETGERHSWPKITEPTRLGGY